MEVINRGIHSGLLFEAGQSDGCQLEGLGPQGARRERSDGHEGQE